MNNNHIKAASNIKKSQELFNQPLQHQTPKYLWIGCSDSRVPANQIMGLKPGEVLVHRNVANLCPPSDISFLAVVQYAVMHLKVEDIFVTGHYGCGGVKAAVSRNDYGALEAWLSHIREIKSKYKGSLIGTHEQKLDTLVELNVKQQVLNVAKLPIIQKCWQEGQKISIHGMAYNDSDGMLKNLNITLSQLDHVPEQFRVTKLF